MAARKVRLDQLLVERQLTPSREKAQALILAGAVLVNQQKADKPGRSVPEDAAITLLGQTKYVSRGGLKLEAALEAFQLDVTGWTCLDVGASTGGFTDCLLQQGAAKVYAVDVGPSQLDWKIRSDPRVVVRDNTNARHLSAADVPEPVDLLVCDVSFISVTIILPAAVQRLRQGGRMVILVKPQFEAGRAQVGKGGIVRDPAVHREVCHRIESFVQTLGFRTQLIDSPVAGAEGNREFLLYACH
jgi:23S rRNA (cytidine1920-2'-O)/16S rRNA (cytidine1409-2'-O)-methyltransferase